MFVITFKTVSNQMSYNKDPERGRPAEDVVVVFSTRNFRVKTDFL